MDCRLCVAWLLAGLAEGPCWWAEKQVLLWVDIEASRIGLFDPQRVGMIFCIFPPMWVRLFPRRLEICCWQQRRGL